MIIYNYQMPTRTWLFCSVRLCEAEDVAHGRDDRLQIELRRLREVSLFSVVVEVEKGRTPFDLCLDDGRWSDLEVASTEEVIPEALHHHRAKLQNLKKLEQI